MGILTDVWHKITGSADEGQQVPTDKPAEEPMTMPQQPPSTPPEGEEKEAPVINPQPEEEKKEPETAGAGMNM